ncbi:hypothetical protein ABJI51_03310 [Amycolatopsis sp. NEAU-NG30]|uniref:Uncharacterized protein n=1 Tax=Amycolatopsis melonis TaxID=3156488 RepID=A0ABV0L6Z7_9PSEU
MNSAESRVALAAGQENLGTVGGFLDVRATAPVSCYAAAAATVAAGVVAAFATGAALAAAAHHFGGHHHFDSADVHGGSPVDGGSVESLIGTRIGALSAA